MKLPQEQKDEIINGMLDMLDPEAVEQVEEIKEIAGRDLINLHNVYKDKDGNQILPGIKYMYSVMKPQAINHKQKMGHLIANAANMDELITALGAYLVKYAADKSAVIQSIPVHLSLQNLRINGN
jgi:hypothetical protein